MKATFSFSRLIFIKFFLGDFLFMKSESLSCFFLSPHHTSLFCRKRMLKNVFFGTNLTSSLIQQHRRLNKLEIWLCLSCSMQVDEPIVLCKAVVTLHIHAHTLTRTHAHTHTRTHTHTHTQFRFFIFCLSLTFFLFSMSVVLNILVLRNPYWCTLFHDTQTQIMFLLLYRLLWDPKLSRYPGWESLLSAVSTTHLNKHNHPLLSAKPLIQLFLRKFSWRFIFMTHS